VKGWDDGGGRGGAANKKIGEGKVIAQMQ